jgi:hypothetical protein
MVPPTCFGLILPSSGSVASAFWEMLNWGAVNRILCQVTWCVAICTTSLDTICFGITLPSSGSVPSAFWEMLDWGAVDRILWMDVMCLATWCMLFPCHAVPPKGLDCVFPIWLPPHMIHTCYAVPVPCHDHDHGKVRHGHVMACVN